MVLAQYNAWGFHAPTAGSRPSVKDSDSMKILIVEDNDMNRDMLSRRLERKGFQVIVAIDGQQGLTLAQAELPALILMDMGLPVLDGWEATRRLKADDVTRHIPIIALTAHAMSHDREKCLAAGCDDYATKPVDFAELLKKIQACLQRKVRV
jgi:CheY-like chemotaxis protein